MIKMGILLFETILTVKRTTKQNKIEKNNTKKKKRRMSGRRERKKRTKGEEKVHTTPRKSG